MRNHEISKQSKIFQITFWIVGLMLFAVLAYAPKTYANQANNQNINKSSFKNRPLDRNDPELIAFYEQLFGKTPVKKSIVPNKVATNKKNSKPVASISRSSRSQQKTLPKNTSSKSGEKNQIVEKPPLLNLIRSRVF